jgi:hypothetical protein
LSFNPSSQTTQKQALDTVQANINKVRKWMLSNKLKINDNKTEFIILGSKTHLCKSVIDKVVVSREMVTFVESVKSLGLTLDKGLSMTEHINTVCKSAHYSLYNLRRIRKFLTIDATTTLIHALITSKLDYANSTLYGVPDKTLNKLQRIQNSAARLVMN